MHSQNYFYLFNFWGRKGSRDVFFLLLPCTGVHNQEWIHHIMRTRTPARSSELTCSLIFPLSFVRLHLLVFIYSFHFLLYFNHVCATVGECVCLCVRSEAQGCIFSPSCCGINPNRLLLPNAVPTAQHVSFSDTARTVAAKNVKTARR